MKRYKFLNAIIADVPAVEKDAGGRDRPTVATRKFTPGDEISEKEILAGCLASLIYTGSVEEIPEPAPETKKK